MVDPYTRLDNAAASFDKITYFYTVIGAEDSEFFDS